MAARDVGPFLKLVRSFLLGRTHANNLRFQQKLAPRPGPEANLPEGPSHKLSSNYYFTRDGRREVARPAVLADAAQGVKAIAAGEGGTVAAVAKKSKTPGKAYNYSDAF